MEIQPSLAAMSIVRSAPLGPEEGTIGVTWTVGLARGVWVRLRAASRGIYEQGNLVFGSLIYNNGRYSGGWGVGYVFVLAGRSEKLRRVDCTFVFALEHLYSAL